MVVCTLRCRRGVGRGLLRKYTLFFKVNTVTVQYTDVRLVHFFLCGAKKGKGPVGDVFRYQSKDPSGKTDLKSRCFG